MKIQATTKAIQDAIGRLASIKAPSKLSGCYVIQFDAVEFGGLAIKRATIDATAGTMVDAEVIQGGSCAIDMGFFSDKTKDMEGTLEIATDKTHMHIKCGREQVKILILSGDEFLLPDLGDPQAGRNNVIKFESSKVAKALFDMTVKAIYSGDGRPQLTGVGLRCYDGMLKIYGADGRRLHVVDLGERFGPVSLEKIDDGLLIPPEAVSTIGAAFGDEKGPLSIYVGERSFSFTCGNTWLRFRLQGATPANITPYLMEPEYDIDVTFNRLEMMKISSRAEGLNSGVYVDFDQLGAVVYGKDVVGNEYSADVTMSGQPCKLYFNGGYFRSLMQCVEGDEVRVLGSTRSNMLTVKQGDRLLILAMMRR